MSRRAHFTLSNIRTAPCYGSGLFLRSFCSEFAERQRTFVAERYRTNTSERTQAISGSRDYPLARVLYELQSSRRRRDEHICQPFP